MKKIQYLLIVMTLIIVSACTSSSIDGEAQEEKYNYTDSEHTSFPAHNTNAQAEDSIVQSQDTTRDATTNR
jgi:peptidoglycan hydrolase CwlO-like protein